MGEKKALKPNDTECNPEGAQEVAAETPQSTWIGENHCL
jgi:hypothetical protein